MTYLVNFFWDRVLRAVFNSCRQIPLTYFNAGNQLTPNSTMDDMHRSSKSGQGVWQLIQGIQETSWSWFKTKGISWTAKYQFDREDSQKDVIIFSLELFWIQELPSAAMRRFRQPFLGIDFPDILRNCSIAVFQYNRIMSEIVISFSNHIRISCCLSSGHVLETCFFNFFEFGGKAKIIASVRFERGLGLQGITGLLLLPDLSKGFQEALPSHQCGKCAMS